MENFPISLEWITGINQLRSVGEDTLILIVSHFANIQKAGYSSLRKDQVIEILSKKSINSSKAEATCTAIEQLTTFTLDNTEAFSKEKFARLLLENTLLEANDVETLSEVYERHASTGRLEKAIRLGQLLDLNWSVRNYRQSNEVKEINTLMVVLDFKIADSLGHPRNESMILSLSDFKALLNKVKEIKDSLESF